MFGSTSSVRWACTGCWSRPGCCRRRPLRLDADPEIGPDEVRIAVERLNLDAASFRQLVRAAAGDGDAVRAAVLDIVADARQDAEPGHRLGRHADRRRRRGGPGVAAGPAARRPGGHPGVAHPHAAAASPTGWPAGTAAPSRCRPRARRSSSPAPSPPCCPTTCPTRCRSPLLDVCGAPAATARVVRADRRRGRSTVLGAAGKSGSLSLAAARARRRRLATGLVRTERGGRRADRRGAGRPGRRRRRDAIRWPSRPPWRRARPTSPSCAWTCPAPSTARSWRPPRAAP